MDLASLVLRLGLGGMFLAHGLQMGFAENQIVKAFLELSAEDGLPLILLDGEIVLAGQYPSRAELARWVEISASDAEPKPAKSCCSGKSCC